MRISQLAEHSGVLATTLRFHEGAGLSPADRTSAGYRVYGEDAVERQSFIGAADDWGCHWRRSASCSRCGRPAPAGT
ncbi:MULTISPECIES: MerR family transcriptional regulator [unclassified Streptomyces]|uniref:MerR family transcriptional regulator n=1 Tax=unclassified Streptomyces TaxID=2593676 RepID=UPI002DDB8D01|nr:MerR family transcriptional regulator [Streptomyces sp. NBC_01445]